MKSLLDIENLIASLDPGGGVRSDLQPMVPPLSEQPIPAPAPKMAMPKPMPQASSIAPEPPMPTPEVDVSDYLMKKNALGKYSDENRQKLIDENGKYDLGGNAMAALGAIGAGFLGRDPMAAGNAVLNRNQSARDNKLTQFDKGRENLLGDIKRSREDENFDPTSARSQAFRKAIESNFPDIAKAYGGAWADVSAADQDAIFKPLQLKENVESRKQAARLANQNRKDLFDMKANEKKTTADEKKKTALLEVQDRADNINSAIDTLDGMIKDDGTWEALGSHNQDIDRLVDQIATDAAKLMDPNSVARPGEVELVKQGLVKSGFKNSNGTARDILKNFKGEVARRAQNAYKIRGIEAPESIQTTSAPAGDGWNDQKAARLRELRSKAMGSGVK